VLNRLAIVTPAVFRRSLELSTLAKRPALHHPQPRGDWLAAFPIRWSRRRRRVHEVKTIIEGGQGQPS
jgi:hypothetical protein